MISERSERLPRWACGRAEAYWEAADLYERANGRLYQEVEFALPVELSWTDRVALSEVFARHLSARESLPYTLVVHEGYGRNPHAHVLISERRLDGHDRSREQWFRRWNPQDPALGGALKSGHFRRREWVQECRSAWAEIANAALAQAGSAARIDARSHAARGLSRIAQIHLGPGATALERRGIRTERGERFRAIAAANSTLAVLERELADER